MAPTVVITGDYTILQPIERQGMTFWGWSFPVVVDGQAGVYVLWIDTNDTSYADTIRQEVIDDLTADPNSMSGIATADPAAGDGDGGTPGEGDQGDGGGAVADGGDGGGDGGGDDGGGGGGGGDGGGGGGGGRGDSV